MCGVLGLVHPRNQVTSVGGFRASLEVIKHRGPDALNADEFENGKLFLGHSRLSILDLSEHGSQPMKLGSSILVYNGEIYNHLELREKLGQKFGGHSDTETLLWGLDLKGAEFLNSCRGMFAGAWWNPESRKLILFRDSMGIKPLYFLKSENTFAFSSEIKALVDLEVGAHEVDEKSLDSYLNYENFPQHVSLFKDVISLKPGEIVEVNVDTLEIRSSQISVPNYSQSSAPSPEEVLEILRDSVHAHLLSDVPVAVYMSGGLDTSTVATLAAQKDSSITGFTGYFDVKDQYYDESDLAELVAKRAKIELKKVKITPQDFIDNFEDLIWHLDEPRMGMGSFSQYMVAKKVAETHKVILSGHGGDELFAGYSKFKAAYLMSSQYSLSDKNAMLKNINSREIPGIGYSVANKLMWGTFPATPRIFDRDNDLYDSHFQLRGKDPVKDLQKYFLEVYLPGLLMVEDRISMAHGLETRVPLLDQRVIAAALSVPMEEHLKGGVLKSYMKRAVSEILPSELLNAPKRGFPTPLRLWFRNELFDYLQSQLLDDFRIENIISRTEVEDMLEAQKTPHKLYALDERRAHRIWMLLCLNVWARKFEVSI